MTGFFDRLFGRKKKQKEQEDNQLTSTINQLREENRDYQRVLEKSRTAEREARAKLEECAKARQYAEEQVKNLSEQLYNIKKEHYDLKKTTEELKAKVTALLLEKKAKKPTKKTSKTEKEAMTAVMQQPTSMFLPDFTTYIRRRMGGD